MQPVVSPSILEWLCSGFLALWVQWKNWQSRNRPAKGLKSETILLVVWKNLRSCSRSSRSSVSCGTISPVSRAPSRDLDETRRSFPEPLMTRSAEGSFCCICNGATHVLIWRLEISWFVLIGQVTIDPTPSRRLSSAGGTNLFLFPLCNDKTFRNIIISKSFASPLTTCIEMGGRDMDRQTAWLHKPHFLRKPSRNVCMVYVQHNMVCLSYYL